MIQLYDHKYRQEIIDLILYVQNQEWGLGMSIEDQRDLLDINESYLKDKGGFWIALNESGKFIGSIGLKRIGTDIGVLRRFFVLKEYRGKEHGVGAELYDAFLNFAKENGVSKIILDTPSTAKRAHSFYIKVGFKEIADEELPVSYDYPKVHSPRLFLLEIQ